jgi:hypothetical protein
VRHRRARIKLPAPWARRRFRRELARVALAVTRHRPHKSLGGIAQGGCKVARRQGGCVREEVGREEGGKRRGSASGPRRAAATLSSASVSHFFGHHSHVFNQPFVSFVDLCKKHCQRPLAIRLFATKTSLARLRGPVRWKKEKPNRYISPYGEITSFLYPAAHYNSTERRCHNLEID